MKNLTSIKYLPSVLICNCKSMSTANSCNFNRIQRHVSPTVSMVTCICDKYHIGESCENVANYCLIGSVCKLSSNFNHNLICENVDATHDQANSNLTYKCNGECSSGFYKNENGACIGKLILK